MTTERRDPAAVRLIRPVAGARHVTSARTHARTRAYQLSVHPAKTVTILVLVHIT